jgi:hypothetical protein
MPVSLSRLIRSEGQIRALLSYLVLLIVPPLLMLLVIATKFHGLQSPAALDQVQLARHLSAGDGFTTSVIRPLSLVFKADLEHHPDLYNPPGHPLVLMVFFQLLHPGDRVTAGVGAILWTLTVWLTFAVARVWFRPRVAVVAALFWAANLAGLTAAIEGLPNPLMAIGVTFAVWLAFPNLRDTVEATVNEMKWWRIFLVGLACAAAFLTHFALAVVALVLGSVLVASQKPRWRTLVLFAVGFLLPVVPWWLRNYYAGTAAFGLSWYDILTGTASYPGDSVWRTMALPPAPLQFLAMHPLQIARKLVSGLGVFRAETFRVLDPVVVFLFAAGVIAAGVAGDRRRASGVVSASLILGVAGSCLLRPEPAVLLAWGPLLAILGAAQLDNWLQQRVKRVVFEGIKMPQSKVAIRRHEPHRRAFGPRAIAAPWIRLAVYSLVVVLVVFPLIGFMTISRSSPGSQTKAWAGALAELVPRRTPVMTDQPAAVAWYTQRPAVLLCQREEELAQFERVVGPIDALVVTSAIGQLPAQERGDWWQWIAAPRGVYRGLAPAAQMPPNTLLRVRPKESS